MTLGRTGIIMDPNAMTPPPTRHVVTPQNKEVKTSDKVTSRETYRRLLANEDFKKFYEYLDTCYNSYMESGGSSQTPKDMKDDLLREAATIYKIQAYIKRQAN